MHHACLITDRLSANGRAATLGLHCSRAADKTAKFRLRQRPHDQQTRAPEPG